MFKPVGKLSGVAMNAGWAVLLTLALSAAGCGKQQQAITGPDAAKVSMLSAQLLAGGRVPSLGTATSFAVLGASTVTCTNASTVTGDVGVSPGSATTGFYPDCIVISGTIHGGDGVAAGAHSDAVIAYNVLKGVACDYDLTGQDLGGKTLAPGVYCFSSSVGLTGQLTLDGGGNPNAVWIFQIGSQLLTGTNSSVVMAGSGQPCNVFWQVGSSATIGTGTAFAGNILALASITLVSGTSLSGRALALNGAVTLDGNTVTACSSSGKPGRHRGMLKVTGGGQIPVPDPDAADPDALGTGRASFGFDAQRDEDGAKGHLNYVNHVTGRHVNGKVDNIRVIAINPDGSPMTVQFSGTGRSDMGGEHGPSSHVSRECSFVVTVEDHGEPGTSDEFGIRVTGGLTEARSQRVIRRGNIQFKKL